MPYDWERVNDMQTVVSDANYIQQIFSHEHKPTLWHAIPAFEELQTAWEKKHDSPKYHQFKNAITTTLAKIGKYYKMFDDKTVYVLALGTFFHTVFFYLLTQLTSASPVLQADVY